METGSSNPNVLSPTGSICLKLIRMRPVKVYDQLYGRFSPLITGENIVLSKVLYLASVDDNFLEKKEILFHWLSIFFLL